MPIEALPTIQVKNFKSNSDQKFLVINERDFDPDIHTAIDDHDNKRLQHNVPFGTVRKRGVKRVTREDKKEPAWMDWENVNDGVQAEILDFLEQPGMTVAKLKEFAASQEIELEAAKKDEIVSEILDHFAN